MPKQIITTLLNSMLLLVKINSSQDSMDSFHLLTLMLEKEVSEKEMISLMMMMSLVSLLVLKNYLKRKNQKLFLNQMIQFMQARLQKMHQKLINQTHKEMKILLNMVMDFG